jgi:hypothetical protein
MMAEHKRTTYFVMQREMAHDEYKEKREEERAWKQEGQVATSYSGLMDYFTSIISMCRIKFVMHFIRLSVLDW